LSFVFCLVDFIFDRTLVFIRRCLHGHTSFLAKIFIFFAPLFYCIFIEIYLNLDTRNLSRLKSTAPWHKPRLLLARKNSRRNMVFIFIVSSNGNWFRIAFIIVSLLIVGFVPCHIPWFPIIIVYPFGLVTIPVYLLINELIYKALIRFLHMRIIMYVPCSSAQLNIRVNQWT